MMLDRESLKISEVHQTTGLGWSRGAPFSDGQHIGYILPDKEVLIYASVVILIDSEDKSLACY